MTTNAPTYIFGTIAPGCTVLKLLISETDPDGCRVSEEEFDVFHVSESLHGDPPERMVWVRPVKQGDFEWPGNVLWFLESDFRRKFVRKHEDKVIKTDREREKAMLARAAERLRENVAMNRNTETALSTALRRQELAEERLDAVLDAYIDEYPRNPPEHRFYVRPPRGGCVWQETRGDARMVILRSAGAVVETGMIEP